MDQNQLTALFRRLGARDPEAWARSQVEEGMPQLARFLFLRQAWRNTVREGDSRWIDAAIERAQADPNAPFAGIGLALGRLRGQGAADADVTDVVRGMQAEFLFRLCYLLDDPGEVEPEVADVAWRLVQLDADGNSADTISGLHESVLETDPTGRQMRRRPDESR